MHRIWSLIHRWKRRVPIIALAFMIWFCPAVSSAVTYNLRAVQFNKTMADGVIVPMWGFASCSAAFSTCSAPDAPGPTLVVPPGDPTLTIQLQNTLTVPVSLIIPGQSAALSPTYVGGRVMSFTTETAPATTGTYTWNNVKSGTFLYQSGTNPAVQVQMGLYGALKIDAAVGEAYPGIAYDTEAILVFSEIDPVIHGHVANGTYGTPPPAGITSTVDYLPEYFLINGRSYSVTSPPAPINAGVVNQRLLIRYLNAGLQTHVPVFQRAYLSIVSEDGNVYPFPKRQYALILPAGKTMDAIFTPAVTGIFPIYDRRLNLTNAGASPGGMLANLSVGSDLIFSDGFESGNFSAWSSEVDAEGDLNVTAAAAMAGVSGMAALIDNTTAMYVGDNSPVNEPRYRARFYFDPNSIVMASGNAHFIMVARNATAVVVRIEFRRNGNAYQLRASVRNDGGAYFDTAWFTITDAPHPVEFDWKAATAAGANDGYLSLWIDNVLMQTLTGIDSDTLRIEESRLGPLSGIDAGTSGTAYFDDFVSRRFTFIGP